MQTRRRVLEGLGSGIALAAIGSPSGVGAAPAAIKLVAFAGASNWPTWVGMEKGFFAAEDVQVALELTPNSVELAKNLYSGRYDLALTSVDNIVAYDEGQGEAELPGRPDFVAVMGVDNGLLSLMAQPGIASVGDLRGKTVAVDALTTGFAFVLREMLGAAGLGLGDVTTIAVGGGAQRLSALREKKFDSTLLNTPLDLLAEGAGMVRLGRAAEIVGAYQGIVGAARRDWAEGNRDGLVRFIKAFAASVRWMAEPGNKDEAVRIFIARSGGTTPRPLAERIHAELTDPRSGIYRDLRVDPEGLRTVLRLREKYATSGQPLSDPSRYVDDSYRAAALRS